MRRYDASFQELDSLMGLLYRIFNIRITLFDLQDQELDIFRIKGMSPYCAVRRRKSAFDRACRDCDRRHLADARRTGDVNIYHCHNGLLEGAVPLYDKRGIYLGAIVFGQLRDPGMPVPAGATRAQRALYGRLRPCTPDQALDIGLLLKCVSEHIIQHEIIRYRNKPWADLIEKHVAANIGRRITLQDLADVVGHSTSFVTHHFRSEFGMSPKEYIGLRRMEAARSLLESGLSVGRTADRLGFYDPFHFSKRFKAHWGAPPKTFKPDAAERPAAAAKAVRAERPCRQRNVLR